MGISTAVTVRRTRRPCPVSTQEVDETFFHGRALRVRFLVAQRREKVVTTPADDPLGCVYLGVHRIGGDHHPVEV